MRTTLFSTLSFATLALFFMSVQHVQSDECDINPQNCTQFVLPGQGVDADDKFVCADGDCKTYLKVSPDDKTYGDAKLITGDEINAKHSGGASGGNGTITGSSRLDAQCASYLVNSDNASETAKKMCGGAGNDSASATGETDSGGESFTSYGTRNGGRQAWRIPKEGPEFGKSIKVVFSDGHTVIVPDTSKCYREKDGFVFKPGTNGEYSETGTAHGGVYLHAPYGNSSTKATFYPN